MRCNLTLCHLPTRRVSPTQERNALQLKDRDARNRIWFRLRRLRPLKSCGSN